MRSLTQVVGRELEWQRTAWLPPVYTLFAGTEAFARLESTSLFLPRVTAQSAEGTWRFRRPSLFSWRLLIEDAHTGSVVGEYLGRPRGGRLRFTDGAEYRFSRVGFIPRTIRVAHGVGFEVVSVTWRWLAFRRVAVAEIHGGGSGDPRLGLLTLLAFYVLLLRRRRAAAASSG
jgi:hypothetical protein